MMVFLESSTYCTCPDFLGKLLAMSLKLFYLNRAKDEHLDWRVRETKVRMRDALGTRLHDSSNSLLLAALALHPTYKNIQPPAVGIPRDAYVENNSKNILTFFFSDLRRRMHAALNETIARLKLAKEAPPAPVDPGDNLELYFIQGYRAALSESVLPDQEIRNWLESAPIVLKPPQTWSSFWAGMVGRPLLTSVAKAIGHVQSSNSASERTFSLADYLSGGDRASTRVETLNARLILKQNTPHRAKLQGVSLFQAITKPAEKDK
jgi:hypothetical protein